MGVTTDSNTERLCHLTAYVLSLDDNGRPLQDDGVWGRLFLQLSNQAGCVKAAAAAFGAAYESSLNDAIVNNPATSSWRYYGSALARLQSDLTDETADPEALALASMVLACVEILSQHEQNAFTHFLGAVQILTRTYQRRQGAPSSDILSHIKDELVKVNLSIGSYALAQTPAVMHLEPHQLTAGDDHDVFCEPELAVDAAMSCLHRSYQFIESANRLRYTYPSWKEHDPIMCQVQSDAVSQCCKVLDGLAALATKLQTQHSFATSSLKDSETLAEIYAMRTQLTAALVYLLCVHDPLQTAHDEHMNHFRSIVSDAAASSRLRRRTKPRALKRFSTRPGIVGPLFIVSAKCRDPSLRALATTMLSEQGREGPTDGRIMAAIGARLAALETSASVPSSPGAPLTACDVLEDQRIHGFGVSHSRVSGEGRRIVDVQFSRPSVPLVEGWGHVDYSCMDSWDFWTESVEI